jgi:hypothetical protein
MNLKERLAKLANQADTALECDKISPEFRAGIYYAISELEMAAESSREAGTPRTIEISHLRSARWRKR